ncbi:MAG: hypothetical protein QOG42_274 [Solirubrobacteraceae bacterium]|jgi:phosphoglycerol transferase|nr:hypothetical protein [Solirubrobacteraceae bacterium]
MQPPRLAPSTGRRASWLPELAWVLATALVAGAVAIVDLKLWKMDAHVPIFGANGDGAYYLATVKDVVEHGWFWHNPDLGAPFGQANYDFAAPFGDVAHYVIVALLGLVLGDPVVVFNAFFLLCFALIAVVAYAVLRDLGAAPVAALVAGVLFAFVPYHLVRNEGHLFLTSYYAIPLGVWLVVTLAEGRTLLRRGARRRVLTVVGVCLVVGAASNYYAVFSLLLMATVVPIAALAQRSWHVARQGAAVVAIVAASFLLCHSPAIVYPLVHGANETVGARTASESELYGLRLAEMLLPRPQHRVAALAHRGQVYATNSALPRGEGFSPSVGTVAVVGLAIALVVLLATGLGGATSSLRRARIAAGGAVALVAMLIGTTGGGSALIAYELSPQMRAWNRLSIVVAFAALLTIALVLTALGDRWRARGRPAWLLGVLAAAVGVVGILDQTSPSDAPDYASIAAAWRADGAFVAAMQKRLPANTEVLQLPYMSYPEHGPLNGISDYDLFKGYLHSDDLRWTYGAVHGRPSDWMAQQQELAPERLATAAAAAGFGAVYLDRAGYPDGGVATAAALDKLAGPGSSGFSADRRLEFFDLGAARARLAARTSGADRAQLTDALLHPARLDFGSGFATAISGEVGFRWAGPDARLTLDNPLGRRSVRFRAQLFGGAATPSAVTITLPDASRHRLAVTDKGVAVNLPMVLAHGAATLRLQTDGPAAANPPGVVRDLRLRIVDPRLAHPALESARNVAAAAP